MNVQNFSCSVSLFTKIIELQFLHSCFWNLFSAMGCFFDLSSINTPVLACFAILTFIPVVFMWCRLRCREICFLEFHLPHIQHSTFFRSWLVSKVDIFCVQNQTNELITYEREEIPNQTDNKKFGKTAENVL